MRWMGGCSHAERREGRKALRSRRVAGPAGVHDVLTTMPRPDGKGVGKSWEFAESGFPDDSKPALRARTGSVDFIGGVSEFRKVDIMSRLFKRRIAAGALLATAVASSVAGAAIYAAIAPSTTTVVSAKQTAATTIARTVGSQLSVKQIYTRNASGVVEVDVTSTAGDYSPFGGSSSQQAQATGFVYDTGGHIVTNQHVIENADSITVKLADGSTYTATLVGSDASSDLWGAESGRTCRQAASARVR